MKKKKEKDQYIDETTLEIVEKLTYKKKVGFVNLMKDVLGQLGTNLEMYLPSLLHTTLPLLLSSVIKANEDLQHNERDERYAEWGAIRNLGLKRLSSLIDIFPFYDYTPWLTLEFIGYLKPNITRIVSENKDSSTPLLSFFITISKYSTLLYLFEENQFIIPNIIECFSRANISPMIISEILGIIENLLDLQLNSDGHLHLINPFVDLLLFHLKSLNTKPNLSQKILRRQLAVLKNISTFATDGDKAFDLLTMLLPYLVRRIDHNSKLDIISIFSNLFHLLRSKSTIGFIDQISMLFRSFTDQDSRGKLCNVFVEIEKVEIALEGIPPLLFDLNSYSSKMIGDYDYDRRLSAYSKINSLFDISKLSSDDDSDEKEIQPVALVPIIYNLIYYMRDKDVSIYSHSTNSLTVIIQYIAHQVKRYEDKMEEEGGEEGKTIALSYRKLITNLILPNAKRFIKSDDHNLRCQSFDLFSEITKCFKDIHADLAVLISPSFGNYFLAMKNVNIPKKIKVLQLLRGKIEGKLFHFTSKSIVQILIPSLLPFISKTTKANDEGNLVEESIKVIGAFSSILPWSSYYSTLNSFIKLVHKNPQSIKSLMRLCCQLLDHFHFEISDGDQYRDTIQYLNMDFNPPKPLLQLNQGSADDTNGEDVSMADVPSGEPPKVIIKEETTTATATPLSASPKKIISVIINHIIPTFQSFIKEEKGMQSNNIHVALAVVKLLKLLPDHLIQTHLPQLILKIVGNLRVKDQSVRDDTRATLLRVFESLGCSYFPIILTELSTVLQKGYQLHVLGFTLHYLLSNAKSFLSVGCFDDLCLSQLIYLLLEDIFGEAAEKKEVAAIQNSMKEAKKTKSFESFEMIAQFMTFKSQISLFLSPLRALLLSTVSAKVIKKVDDILKKIILGLSHNTSIYFNQPSSNDAIVQMKEGGDDDDDEDDKTGFLVFIYNIVKKNLQFMNKDMKAIKASSDQLSSLLLAQSSKISRLSNAIDKRNKNNNLFLIPDEPVKLRKRKNDVFIMQSTLTSFNQSTSNKKKAVESGSKAERKVEINLHVIGEFGLSLFFAFLQKNKFETKNQKDLQMINPFISLFLSSIASSLHQKTILHTLKCLEKLFYFNLPSTEENMEEILSRLFTLLQQCFQSTSHHHLSSQPSAQQLIKIELSQQCVKTLTVLIHYSEKLKISEDQIKYLVKLVQLNIDNTEVLTQNITFKLIKTIIQKKLIIPEIYDLANQVAEYVVTSQISSIRDTCSKSLVHFLLFYPLEEKRLQQHLDFIVRNLSYKTEEGRESTLSLFHLLISKLPSPEIEKQAEYFFLSLVLRLINEESKSCRIMVSSVIKLLIEKISHPKLLILFNLTKQWFSQSSSSSTTTSSTSSATSHIKQRAGAQVIGIMIEVLHSSFYSKFPDVLSLLYHPISLEDDDGTDDNNNNEVNDDQEDDDEDNKKWEITYYSLISLEKLLSCTPSLILSPDMIKVWKKISELIMHSHTWIRSISSRLFGVLFSQFNPRSISPPSSSSSSSTSPSKKVKGKKKNNNKEEKNNKEEVKGVLYEKGFIFKLTRKFCSQLQSENLSSDLAKQTLKNLIFLTQSIYFNPHLSDDLSILSFSSSLITPRRHQLDDDANADDNNDNDNDDDKRKGNDEIEIDKEIAEMKEENHMQFIHWIFRRLSFMARRSLRRPETVLSSPLLFILLF